MSKFTITPASWSPDESEEREIRAIKSFSTIIMSYLDRHVTPAVIIEKSDHKGGSNHPHDPKHNFALAV